MTSYDSKDRKPRITKRGEFSYKKKSRINKRGTYFSYGKRYKSKYKDKNNLRICRGAEDAHFYTYHRKKLIFCLGIETLRHEYILKWRTYQYKEWWNCETHQKYFEYFDNIESILEKFTLLRPVLNIDSDDCNCSMPFMKNIHFTVFILVIIRQNVIKPLQEFDFYNDSKDNNILKLCHNKDLFHRFFVFLIKILDIKDPMDLAI
uniref:Uncharacterized protein n=1 Tax=Cacopsylla melanoneura TaxID=428564 RepID=A0A8D9BIU7_9HEMI